MEQAQQMADYLVARIDEMRGSDRERGDVPGWVMITLMTAALVAIIWGLAGPWLRGLFTNATTSIDGVRNANPGG